MIAGRKHGRLLAQTKSDLKTPSTMESVLRKSLMSLGLTFGFSVVLALATSSARAQYAPPQPPAPPQPGYPSQPGDYGQAPQGYPTQSQYPQQPDSPGQSQVNARAARLTYLAGEVHIDSATSSGDESAALNMPIVEGMIVATGDNGQAEIEFEDGSLVRLTPNSAVSLINLSINSGGIFVTRLALLPGLSYLELRASSKYQFSIDAGGDTISPVENSAVRVDFDEAPAKIAVLDGSIHVVSPTGVSASAVSGQTIREEVAATPPSGQSQSQYAGQNQPSNPSQGQSANPGYGQSQMPTTVYGQSGYGQSGYGQPPSGGPGYPPSGYPQPGSSQTLNGQPINQQGGQPGGQTSPPPVAGTGRFLIKDSLEPNSWDQWNEDRDQAAANDAANQTTARSGYAGDQGYGWSDLDSNGSWYNVPGQGQVWQPDAAAQSGDDAGANSGADSFDPYGFGDWVDTPGYGYVWASGYSWGWTPFRCGNWGFYGGFGWGWSPGVSCGLPAYGGRGYNEIHINHRLVPVSYHPPVKPKPGPDHNHPMVIVNGGLAPTAPQHNAPVTRTIAGHTVRPLRTIGGGYTPQGGSAVGSALLRDAPMNRATHTAVAGRLPSHEAPALSASIYHSSTWHPVGSPTSNMLPATGRRFSYSPRTGTTSGTTPGTTPGTTQGRSNRSTDGQSGYGRPTSPTLPVTVLGLPVRAPYTRVNSSGYGASGAGMVEQPRTTGGAPVYRVYPNNPTYPGYRPPPQYGTAGQSTYENRSSTSPAYRQPSAPPVQRATPPPSRPTPVPASTGPGKS